MHIKRAVTAGGVMTLVLAGAVSSLYADPLPVFCYILAAGVASILLFLGCVWLVRRLTSRA